MEQAHIDELVEDIRGVYYPHFDAEHMAAVLSAADKLGWLVKPDVNETV